MENINPVTYEGLCLLNMRCRIYRFRAGTDHTEIPGFKIDVRQESGWVMVRVHRFDFDIVREGARIPTYVMNDNGQWVPDDFPLPDDFPSAEIGGRYGRYVVEQEAAGAPQTCTCPLDVIMATGCRCGGA